MANNSQHDLAQITLAVFFIVLMAAASFWVLRPFLPALIWPTMIVVATWPLMLKAQELLGGRRKLAVVVMSVAMLLIFVVPFSLAVGTIVDNAGAIRDWVKSLEHLSLPAPPGWLYWTGYAGWGTALLVWTLLVGGLDNFLRPALIKRGANLTRILISPGSSAA